MLVFTDSEKAHIAKEIKLGVSKAFKGKGRQQKFATRIGVSPSTVSSCVLGKTTPSIKQLIAISDVLDTPLHKLCGFSAKRFVQTGNIVFDNIMNLSIAMEYATFTTGSIRSNTNKVIGKIWGQVDGLFEHQDNE